jgi:predicted secreted protein
MASNAIKAQGTKFEVKTGASTYVEIKGVKDINGAGGGSAAVIDTTDLSSTAKEKAMGIPDEGQLSISGQYLPKDAGQAAVKAARASQAATGFRITYSDSTKLELNGFVLTFERSTAVDDVVTFSCNIEITGAITETVAP